MIVFRVSHRIRISILFRNCYSNYNAPIGQMDKFVSKSPVNRDEKSLKRKGNDYDKLYDAKK